MRPKLDVGGDTVRTLTSTCSDHFCLYSLVRPILGKSRDIRLRITVIIDAASSSHRTVQQHDLTMKREGFGSRSEVPGHETGLGVLTMIDPPCRTLFHHNPDEISPLPAAVPLHRKRAPYRKGVFQTLDKGFCLVCKMVRGYAD